MPQHTWTSCERGDYTRSQKTCKSPLVRVVAAGWRACRGGFQIPRVGPGRELASFCTLIPAGGRLSGPGPAPLPVRPGQIGFVSHSKPRPNWVCLYKPPGPRPADRVPPAPPEIGFVFSRSIACSILHKSFSTKYLPVLPPAQELALFCTFWSRGAGMGNFAGPRPFLPAPGKLALFCTLVPSGGCTGGLGHRCLLVIGTGQLALFRITAPTGASCAHGGKLASFRAMGPARDPGQPAGLRPLLSGRKLALFCTIGPRPSSNSNIRLHTSNFSGLYTSPYYPPCCRNPVEKMACATL